MAGTIAFESIAVPGATPVGLNSASAKSFVNNYHKAAAPNLSEGDRKKIQIVGLIAELKNAGGQDYTNGHAALRQDATVYTGGISNFDLDVAMCALDWNAGNVAGGIATDIPTLLSTNADFDRVNSQILDRCIAFLRAQLRR